jgi:hypothetical protein
MDRLHRPLPLTLLFIFPLLLLGCDSGGSNGGSGNPLDGDLSYEVDGSAQVSITESFFYSTGDGPCQSTQSNVSSSLPIEVNLEPEDVNCDGVSPSEFDGVRVTVSQLTGSTDITLRLLSDGDLVTEATEPESFGGGEAWIVKAGDIPDLSQ